MPASLWNIPVGQHIHAQHDTRAFHNEKDLGSLEDEKILKLKLCLGPFLNLQLDWVSCAEARLRQLVPTGAVSAGGRYLTVSITRQSSLFCQNTSTSAGVPGGPEDG